MSDGTLYFQMEIIKENLSRIKVPGPGDKVFKDECFYSFDSPVRDGLW